MRKCCIATILHAYEFGLPQPNDALRPVPHFWTGPGRTMASCVAVVVVAAGRGLRVGGNLPKQYKTIAGEPVIRPSLARYAVHPRVDLVQPVIHPDDGMLYEQAATGLEVLSPVFGGATRQASVRAGLEALAPHAPDIVLVHDAARPFASQDLVDRAITAAAATGAAIPALAVTDT